VEECGARAGVCVHALANVRPEYEAVDQRNPSEVVVSVLEAVQTSSTHSSLPEVSTFRDRKAATGIIFSCRSFGERGARHKLPFFVDLAIWDQVARDMGRVAGSATGQFIGLWTRPVSTARRAEVAEDHALAA
jgi:hypothetical protein